MYYFRASCFLHSKSVYEHLAKYYRGVSDFLKLGGQVVMRHAAVVAAATLLFCQNLGGQLPTLHTRH